MGRIVAESLTPGDTIVWVESVAIRIFKATVNEVRLDKDGRFKNVVLSVVELASNNWRESTPTVGWLKPFSQTSNYSQHADCLRVGIKTDNPLETIATLIEAWESEMRTKAQLFKKSLLAVTLDDLTKVE